jgi:hypothetical protein
LRLLLDDDLHGSFEVHAAQYSPKSAACSFSPGAVAFATWLFDLTLLRTISVRYHGYTSSWRRLRRTRSS